MSWAWANGNWGLSPRVRGNPAAHVRDGAPGRSIPACAGEPPSSSICGCRRTVYPRVCGGTSYLLAGRFCREGLSPRVRGNRILDGRVILRERSIPACAGEPTPAYHCRWQSGVYPRVCGGTMTTQSTTPFLLGLSPRVRGNLSRLYPYPPGERSIPACAGEPSPHPALLPYRRVYPRVCGGTSWMWRWRSEHRGLSPRVRGNRHNHSGLGICAGSIPACAGEPIRWM